MSDLENTRHDYITQTVFADSPQTIQSLSDEIENKFPGCSIILYGSGISILKGAEQQDVLYDFYVIVPSYKDAFKSKMIAFLNYILPPNVYYLETQNQNGALRAKYAVLSIDHFEKLVSRKTFHSYFWARFAQPCKIINTTPTMKPRLTRIIQTAIDTFIYHATPLIGNTSNESRPKSHDIWIAGLSRSYRAELRAEKPERVKKLLESYGEWPEKVTPISTKANGRHFSALGWKIRSIQGGLLSVLRLLKGTLTFEGGVDYIVWKISRHAGFTVPVRDWERKWPLLGAPFLARRYYKLKKTTHPDME